MKLDFKLKNFFFDKALVTDHFGAKGKNSLKALSRIGAFIRTRARSMLRKRKRIATRGQPPSIHTSDSTITLRNIQFAYDFSTSGMVVGSVLVNTSKKSDPPVPNLLEIGGTTSRRGKTLRYNPHPWMAPALQAELSNLPPQFAASLHT